ncbi:hypothetical protein LZ554_009333 [Drepanopeziza brunnea f. sp. 'monogermtubi']|nr:hypothetical protein LZ554_009333 [Drepanopeziza brunnea f. sp. 'monogermtubi']
MLLTIKPPAHYGYKSFRDYTPPTPPSTSRFSPTVVSTVSSFPPILANIQSLPPLTATKALDSMSSRPHLPPLQQNPSQAPPVPPLTQPMGQLPAPPQQWQGAEESMRNWLHAKAEEDKRKQEEEKTRQESLRLEQRKIEQDMLRTSLAGGIPPHMIPMVFAGMGGGNLPNASLEWAQHYMSQAPHPQQQQPPPPQQLLPAQSQPSPEQLQRRDSRLASQPYPGQQHPAPMTLPSTPIGPPSSAQPTAGFLPSYQMSPAPRARSSSQGQAAATRPPPKTSQLPKLNTGEAPSHHPPAASHHPLQQTQSVQEQQSSPSIYFHHWQPPTTQAATTSNAHQPSTPADNTTSPKKRKATGPQQAAPAPTSESRHTSPPFSQTGSFVSNPPSSRRRGHSRDLPARGMDSFGRPLSRHRHDGFTSQGLTSPVHSYAPEQQTNNASAATAESQRQVRGPQHVSSDSPAQQMQPHQHAHQIQRDPPYSAGPEMRHDIRRGSSEEGIARRASVIKETR